MKTISRQRIAAIIHCLIIGIVMGTASVRAAELEEYPIVTATPPLALEDLGGNRHTLADYRGKVVLVNFWASWCSPCLVEMPGIQRLKQAMADTPFAILAVNSKESKSVIWRFRNLLRVNFTLLMDTDGAATKDWDVQIYPTSYLIGPNGDIRFVAYGAMDWDSEEVMQVIDELLSKSP